MRAMTGGRKLTFVVGGTAVAVLVVGLGAAGAVAASRMLSPGTESKAVIDDAAAQLGVQPEALSGALKEALKNRIDEAVAAGKLTKDQAATLKERIDSAEYPLLFGRGRPGGLGEHGFAHPGRLGVLETASAFLGMSETELREALDDKTLADVAKEKGKTVSGLVNALVTAEEERIDEAVANGRITKAQASDLKSKLSERMEALVNGELRGRGERPHPGFWPGSGSPRAPPAFGGPPA
jgi:polyhydroxyalkanoate synthesis regulator phasin